MTQQLRLMCVLAHPDDESLGIGGTLAKYSDEGVETFLVTATRGERGRFGDAKESPGLQVVGKTRESELLAAAQELGIRQVSFLDYIDGDLDQAHPGEAVAKIVDHLREIRPHVVVTFGPEGGYGHPDHIAICQFTTTAVASAADPEFPPGAKSPSSPSPHKVSKLYYMAWSHEKWAAYQEAFTEVKIRVDGKDRRPTPWPDWAVTTSIDTSLYWETVWRAVCHHKTQMSIHSRLESLPEEHHQALWGSQEYYRTLSLVNGGRDRETDLFEGLR